MGLRQQPPPSMLDQYLACICNSLGSGGDARSLPVYSVVTARPVLCVCLQAGGGAVRAAENGKYELFLWPSMPCQVRAVRVCEMTKAHHATRGQQTSIQQAAPPLAFQQQVPVGFIQQQQH